MSSDTANLRVVITSTNASGPGFEQLKSQAEAAGVSVERLGIRANAAGQQIAQVFGTATAGGGATGLQAFHKGLTDATGAAVALTQQTARIGQGLEPAVVQARALAAQVSLIRERLSQGGAAQFQVSGLSPQELQGIQTVFRAANVEVTQLGANVSRTGQVMRTLQAQPGQGGVQAGILGLGLDQLRQAEVSSVRFTDSLSRGINRANDEMSKLAQGIGHGLGLFSSFGAGIGTAVVVAAITGAVKSATEQFAVFDQQVRGTNALLGLTGQAGEQSFRQMSQDVRQFAVETGTNATEDAKALYQTLSAGIPVGREAFQVLNASANLAVGGLGDVATATNGVTSILNAYNLRASDAAKISDQFFAATQAGKITVDQLGQGIGTVVPIAAALGVSFGEVSGVLAAATNQGVQVGAALEGTRAALNAFLRPTAEAQQVAASLGIQFDATAVHSKGFTQALNDIVAAVGTGPGGQRILATLFGDIQAVNTVLAITGPNAEKTAQAVNQVANASGNAANAADEVNRSLGRAFERSGAQVRELQLRLGELAAVPLTGLLNTVTGIGQALGAWPTNLPAAEQLRRAAQAGQPDVLAQLSQATGSAQARQQQQQQADEATTSRARTLAGIALEIARRVPGPIGQALSAVSVAQDVQGIRDSAQAREDQARALHDYNALLDAGSLEQLKLNRAHELGTLSDQAFIIASVREQEILARTNVLMNEGVDSINARRQATQELTEAEQRRTAVPDTAAAILAFKANAGEVFTPQQQTLALQTAQVQQQIAADKFTINAAGEIGLTQEQQRLQALQQQTRELTLQHNVQLDINAAQIDLERIQLEQGHTRERQLDLENQSLDATIRTNSAREQGLRLGFVVPALQRVATAMGANVDPNSPAFQQLNLAQQFIALRLSTAQAQLRQGQIATDPGRLALEAATRELDFRKQTAQLAADEQRAREAIAKLAIDDSIAKINAQEETRLQKLNNELAVLSLQTGQLNLQKDTLQWILTHVPVGQINPAITAGLTPEQITTLAGIKPNVPLTPEQTAVVKQVVDSLIARFPPGATPVPPVVEAVPASAQAASDAATAAQASADAAQASADAATANATPVPAPPETLNPPQAIPQSQAPPNTLVPGGELPSPIPLTPTAINPQAPGGVPGAIPLGEQPTINQPPVIRGTGVSQSRNITLNQTVNVDASNQTDPQAIATATAQATAQATIDSIQSEFGNAASSDSAGARYGG